MEKIKKTQPKWLDTTGMTPAEIQEWHKICKEFGYPNPKTELAKATMGDPKGQLRSHRLAQAMVENLVRNVMKEGA